MTARSKPLYRISVVAEMLKLHPQTLRMYEKKGLIRPSRTMGQTRTCTGTSRSRTSWHASAWT